MLVCRRQATPTCRSQRRGRRVLPAMAQHFSSCAAQRGRVRTYEVLQGESDVKDRLGAGTDNCDGGVGQRNEIRRDVEACRQVHESAQKMRAFTRLLTCLCTTVNSTNPAGREHLDACEVRNRHRSRHCRSSVHFLHHSSTQLPPSDLPQRRSSI